MSNIAVVIPCHNYAQFVTQALDSVLGQSEPAHEIVVVNDASTDNSVEVIERYIAAHPDAPIRLADMPRNVDVACAQNAGILLTESEYIVCLDADDKIEPDYLLVLRRAMDEDPALGIAYTSVQVLDHETQLVRPVRNFGPFDFDWMATPANPPRTMIPKPAMFRRAMWLACGGFHQTYRAGEDVDFWLRGLALGWTARKASDRPLFTYRVHGSQQMSRSRKFDFVSHYKPWMKDAPNARRLPSWRAGPAVATAEGSSSPSPVVCAVIPVGPAHAAILPSALESIAGQSFREWECVVINDTGQPLSETVMAAYPFARIADGGQRGASHARNVGAKAATAPLVVFLDADDWLMPDALGCMVRRYAGGDASYVYTDWQGIVPDGSRQVVESSEYDRQRAILTLFHPVTILIGRADFLRVGGFDESLRGLEDWELMAHLAHEGLCGARVPRPLLAYRRHTGTEREAGMAARQERAALITERYGDIDMAKRCCGGNGTAIMQAKQAMGGYPQDAFRTQGAPKLEAQPGMVLMEYVGPYAAPVTFLHRYPGGKQGAPYANVDPRDVQRMAQTGQWRTVQHIAIDTDASPEPRPTMSAAEEIADKIKQAEAIKPMQSVDVQATEQVAELVSIADVHEELPPATTTEFEGVRRTRARKSRKPEDEE